MVFAAFILVFAFIYFDVVNLRKMDEGRYQKFFVPPSVVLLLTNAVVLVSAALLKEEADFYLVSFVCFIVPFYLLRRSQFFKGQNPLCEQKILITSDVLGVVIIWLYSIFAQNYFSNLQEKIFPSTVDEMRDVIWSAI